MCKLLVESLLECPTSQRGGGDFKVCLQMVQQIENKQKSKNKQHEGQEKQQQENRQTTRTRYGE